MRTEIEKEKLYRKAIQTWGTLAQIDKAVEECAELIQALQKRKLDVAPSFIDDVLEEMADVEIMLEQLKDMFDYKFMEDSRFKQMKRMKLKRLEKRLE